MVTETVPEASNARIVLIRKALVTVYWLIIAFVLLNYGGVIPVALAAATLAIFLLLLVQVLSLGISDTARPLVLAAASVLVVSLVWVLIQDGQLPGSAFTNPSWDDARPLVDRSVRSTISVTRGDDMAALLKMALPFGIFISALILFDTEERAIRAVKILAIGAGVIAAFSVFQFLALPHLLLFGEKRAYLTSLTGVFVNRNTAGTFFGLSTILLGMLLWNTIGRKGGWALQIWLEGQATDRDRRLNRNALIFALSLLAAVAALLLTRSRGGMGSTFVAVILLVVLTASAPSYASSRIGEKTRFRGIKRILLAMVAVIVVASVFAAFSGQVLLRVESRGLEDGRFCVTPGIIAAIGSNWPFGSGFGSFREVFPAYRDPACGMAGVWDKAHNFYLEAFLSLGFVAVPLMVGSVVALGGVYITGIRRRRRMRYTGVLGLSALFLVAIHATVDFSLQIPGLAVFYAALAAPLASICLAPPPGGGQGGRRSRYKGGQ